MRTAILCALLAVFLAPGAPLLGAQSALDQLRREAAVSPPEVRLAATSPLPEEFFPQTDADNLKQAGFGEPELWRLREIRRLIDNLYVSPVDGQKLYYGALKGMLETLDPNTRFFTPEEYKAFNAKLAGATAGIGMNVEAKKVGDYAVVDFPLKGSPAERAGLQEGDVVVSVDGEDIRPLEEDDFLNKVRGEPGTPVTLVVRRGKAESGAAQILSKTITRETFSTPNVFSEVLRGNVGYIRIELFRKDTDERFMEEVGKLRAQRVRGLIIDLRGNPGGYSASVTKMCSMFLEKDKLIASLRRQGEVTMSYKTAGEESPLDIPLAILVNGRSGSASEVFTGTMQDYKRAVIVGSRTYGKGTVQDLIDFADGSGMRITRRRYFLPSGRSIDGTMSGERGGIEPDIAVNVSDIDAKAVSEQLFRKRMGAPLKGGGVRDAVLEKALEIF